MDTIPNMLCRYCGQPVTVRTRCATSGLPMTAVCGKFGCMGQRLLLPIPCCGLRIDENQRRL